MKVLLMAGLGPYFKDSYILDGSLFDENAGPKLQLKYRRIAGRTIDLNQLHYKNGISYPVLRLSRGSATHLTSFTLRSIMDNTGIEYEFFDLENVWSGKCELRHDSFDVVGLSTTFICDFDTLHQVIDWIEARYPNVVLVIGGQFSTLKYAQILKRFSCVDYVIRGEAEVALPKLLWALLGKEELCNVENLVARSEVAEQILVNKFNYIDINAYPSPRLSGYHPIVPYESMRGCPFGCKFCSYPAASSRWRYKSAEKIRRDWKTYAEENSTQLIRAKDSTFTIPPQRFRELLETLPEIGIGWEAYTRANIITSPEIVDKFKAAHCQYLSIGFESMSDHTLTYMNKQVKASHNLRAFESLTGKDIYYHISFMVGYPGETLEDYEKTHSFIVDRFAGRFMVHPFSLMDETMPVWDDAHLFELEVQDPNVWKHRGMDSNMARELRVHTVNEARWKNENAVFLIWQPRYEMPLIPDLDVKSNYRIEKLIERLGFLARDIEDESVASDYYQSMLNELNSFGIDLELEVTSS